MNPLVSVVVTTYNQASYIEETVQSVLAQDYRPFEVVVVDDGSTDDTAARLATFGDAIRYLFQENQGVAGSRNTGIRLARGELIAFIDGDDLWAPQKLSVQVEAAKAHPHSGLIVVDGVEFDEQGTLSPSLFFEEWCRDLPAGSVTSGSWYRRFLNSTFVTTTSQVMVPARVFETVGLSDGRFRGASDYDLYLRIAAQFEVTMVKEPLTFWRYHSTSVSGPRSRRFYRYLPEDIAILKKQLTLAPQSELALVRRMVQARLSAGVARAYYYGVGQERGVASSILFRLWKENPSHPRILAYLAALWCPDFLRSICARVFRTLCPAASPGTEG